MFNGMNEDGNKTDNSIRMKAHIDKRSRMEYWKMKTLLMVAFVGLSRVNSRLTVTPNDVEVVNGTWVALNCSTDSTSPIIWIKEDEGGFNNKTVFNGSSIAAEFNASYNISRPKQGSFNLEFLATEETASVYRCENEGDSSSAKLDIIESPGQPKMSELRNNYQRHDLRQKLPNFPRSRPTGQEPPRPPKIPEWRIDDYNRQFVPDDPRHNNHESPRKEIAALPSLKALENLSNQIALRHGGNTEPKKGPDDTARIAGIIGAVIGFWCLLSLCKCCCG